MNAVNGTSLKEKRSVYDHELCQSNISVTDVSLGRVRDLVKPRLTFLGVGEDGETLRSINGIGEKFLAAEEVATQSCCIAGSAALPAKEPPISEEPQ